MCVSSTWRKPHPLHVGPLAMAAVMLGIIAAGCGAASPEHQRGDRQMRAMGDQPGIAVVELFTSEGCSSSPPAERQMRAVVARERDRGRRVFPLEFHVTYWNDLGWVDPFSKKDYTRYQWAYSHAGGRDVVSTPQMIVNGRSVFVGSNANQVKREIDQGLSEPANAMVNLTLADPASQSDPGVLKINYKVMSLNRPAVLHLALVERGLVSHVNAGENRGRTLKHDNVVRVFKTLHLKPDDTSGQSTLAIPSDVDRGHTSVIAYVQNPDSMSVLGASKADVER